MISRHLRPGGLVPLLVSLVALFVLYPVMVELDKVRFFRFAFLLLMMLAVYSLGGTRRHFWIALALAAPAALAQLIAYAAPDGVFPLVAILLGLVFLVYTTARVFASVFRSGRVTTDKIAGAISIYLLLGLVFALCFGIVAKIDPGALRASEALDITLESSEAGAEYTFIYYSFVTLTTLGYGDVTPMNHWSQTIAWLEAVVGQLFLAILVARLVGLHIVHSAQDD